MVACDPKSGVPTRLVEKPAELIFKRGMVPRQICQAIAESYAIPLDQVENDARRFLGDLMDHRIVIES